MKIQLIAKEICKVGSLFSGLKSDKLLIVAEETGITLKAHDEVEFVLSSLITPVLEPGVAALGIKDFFDACKDLENGDNVIDISTKVPGSKKIGLHFKSGKSSVTKPRETSLERSAQELTIFETSEVISEFELDTEVISEIVKRSIYSTDGTRPNLQGIQIEIQDFLCAFSTNGNVFTRIILPKVGVNQQIKSNLHHRSWLSAQKLIRTAAAIEKENEEQEQEQEGRIKVQILENFLVKFQLGDFFVVSRVLSESLPPLNKLFSPLPPNRLKVSTEDRKLFKPLLRMEGNIKMELGDEGMVLSAETGAASGKVIFPIEIKQKANLILTHDFFSVVNSITAEDFFIYYANPAVEGHVIHPIVITAKASDIDHSVVLGVVQPRLTR